MSEPDDRVSISIVVEAPDDGVLGSGLADRVILEGVEWIESETIEHFRRWRGIGENEPFATWVSISQARRTHGDLVPKSHGKFQDGSAEPAARTARWALLLLADAKPRPRAVVLLWDVDKRPGDPVRALAQARADRPWPFEVALGICDRKRECWILNGFVPRSDEETRALEDARRELGFDPTVDGHLLTASKPDAKRSAKRVHALLVSGGEREEACWRETPLALLEERGAGTGLAAYLEEVRTRIVPLFKA